jgi:hypothetical protein
MSDESTYPTVSNIIWRVESAFVDVLTYADEIVAVFGGEDDVNIRRWTDTSKGDKTLPATTAQEMNEYRFDIIITAKTDPHVDGDGQQVQGLIAGVRSEVKSDSTPDYVTPRGVDHFERDNQGFVQALNETERNIVFHKVLEGEERPNIEGKNRKITYTLTGYGYPGAIS